MEEHAEIKRYTFRRWCLFSGGVKELDRASRVVVPLDDYWYHHASEGEGARDLNVGRFCHCVDSILDVTDKSC